MSFFAIPNLVKALASPRETTALTFLPNFGRSRWPLQRDYEPTEAYVQGWDTCAWVFACISRIAQCVSSLPWRVLERHGTAWESIPNGHQIEDLIESPNDRLSRKTMMTLAVQHLLLPGEFFWKKVMIGKRVDEIWPINPLVVDPVPSAAEWITEYRIRKDLASPGDVLPAEVVTHGVYVNPRMPFRGHSPFRALRQTVAMDNDQVTWNRNLPRNGNVPRGALVDPSLDEDTIDEANDRLAARSGPDAAGKPIILGGQAKWERMALTPVEVDWFNSTRMSVHRICAVYNVLPSIILPESTGGLNNSNLDYSIRYLWEHSSLPVADLIEEALNQSFFSTREERRKYWIHYDTSGVKALQAKLKEQLEAISEGVKNGIALNDMISLMEVPVEPQPGGDQPVRSSTLIEVDFAGPNEAGAEDAKL